MVNQLKKMLERIFKKLKLKTLYNIKFHSFWRHAYTTELEAEISIDIVHTNIYSGNIYSTQSVEKHLSIL